jgi:hypothetical protein
MSFSTFIQHIKSEKYRQLGLWKSSGNGIPLNPIHWFQFADDAAAVSGQEKEIQICSSIALQSGVSGLI